MLDELTVQERISMSQIESKIEGSDKATQFTNEPSLILLADSSIARRCSIPACAMDTALLVEGLIVGPIVDHFDHSKAMWIADKLGELAQSESNCNGRTPSHK
jgi:hypothetical protein